LIYINISNENAFDDNKNTFQIKEIYEVAIRKLLVELELKSEK